MAGESYTELINYINTAKAFAIIMGILLSVVIAFFSGAIIQFLSRLLFTFDYKKRLKRYSGLWGGFALSVITYFILIKGAKGTSFLTPESVAWIKTHTWTILLGNFFLFAILFQLLTLLTRINILKPIVLIGTFGIAMSFASNDLVNFIGVPLAGLTSYQVASGSTNPLAITMEALEKPIQSNTFLLLLAGAIMVATLSLSRKSRTVTQTELGLGRQHEGVERFGSSILSRIIVGQVYAVLQFTKRILPTWLKRKILARLDSSDYETFPTSDGKAPSFDLLRASVNMIVASAIISFATSLKLPLSTTYVTFMVSMGTSLSDQAWGRESAVYRITGVITVIGGWFFTALAAFTTSLVFALVIYFLKLPGIIGLLLFAAYLIFSTSRYHLKKEKEKSAIEAFSLKTVTESDNAIRTTFDQTGRFLKNMSDNLGIAFEAASSEDIERLRNTRSESKNIQKWSNAIIANIFETLYLLNNEDIQNTHKYSRTIGALKSIAECQNDMVTRTCAHFENFHSGFTEIQKEELRHIKTFLTRLLWNTSIMLTRRKMVDYDYVCNQCDKLKNLISECDKNQTLRIQRGESKTRLSILFYGLLENSIRIAEQTQNMLNIFKESFVLRTNNNKNKKPGHVKAKEPDFV
jgi:hypothetical protein